MRVFEIFKKNITFSLLMLLCSFPLMVFHIQSKIIIIWALVSFLIMLKQSNKKFTKENVLLYLYNVSWILWLLITLSYSTDILGGLKEFERIISILIIPLIIFFFFKKITNNQRFLLFLTFIISILCFTIYSYIYIFNFFETHYYSLHIKGKEFDLLHYIHFHLKVSKVYLYGNGVDSNFILFYHKSYYSLSLLFCIFLLAYYSFKKPKYKPYFIGIAIIFILMLFIHASKVHIFLFFLFSAIIFLFFLLKKNLSTLKYKSALTIFFFIIITIGYYGIIKNSTYLGDSFISRKNINNCSFKLIKNEPVFGYGFGSVKQFLKDCYKQKLKKNSSFYYPYKQNHNTHNYYIYIYLSGGLIGLFLFLLMIYKNISIALQNYDTLYLFFLMTFFVTLFFENSLYRIYGILYYTIFNSIFLQKYLRIK